MSELKNLTCTCCGGRINRDTMKCEYCGTEYKIKDDIPIIRMERYQNPVQEFKACILVDDNDLNMCGEEYMKHAINRLCEEMLPAVLRGMSVKTARYYDRYQTLLEGTIKIVIPKEDQK